MAVIYLETIIESDLETCFDLSRSIDLHKISTAHTNEKAVAGKTSGLINLDEFVTWEAKHFGIVQKLTSKITFYKRPFHFRDEQLKGAFKYIIHDHYFEKKENKVLMKDIFSFSSPAGVAGKIIDKFIMTDYLKKLLLKRNEIIKDIAESEDKKNTFLKSETVKNIL